MPRRARTSSRQLILTAAALFVTAAVATSAESGPSFKAGFAERDVSPKIGMEQPGGYGKAYHRVFHDPCKVRAVVFDDGDNRVAIVGIDALFIRRATVAAVRKRIEAKCGIRPDSVLVSASHSHSAGPIGHLLPGELGGADPLVVRLATEESVIANPEYLTQVETGIVDAVVEADKARVDAAGSARFGQAEGVAFNRRFHMKNGLTFTHPGQGNPEIVKPAGPVDPQVGVLGVWDAKGAFLGCIVNFACHCTTGPGGISADYVYYVERTIRSVMGEKAIVVFLAGAAGDVTQVDNRNPNQIKQFGEISARFVGGQVGAAALACLLQMEQATGPLAPVVARSRDLSIPRRVPRPEHLAKAREIVAKDRKSADATEWTFAKELVVLNEKIAREPKAPVETQAIQVGPVVFLANPAEYFCQFGLDLKKGSRFPFTFPVSNANGSIGYVPTEEAMSEGGGGYETRLTSYSNLVPKAGRLIADTLLDLSTGLQPGGVPKPKPLPAFQGAPWPYGNLAPQVD